MASANVVRLQNQINRLAPFGEFSTVGVDGGLGPNTNNGALAALTWVGTDGCRWFACVADDLRAQASDMADALAPGGHVLQDAVATYADRAATLLAAAGDQIGAAPENAQPSSSGVAPNIPMIPHKAVLPSGLPAGSSILAAFSHLQPWQKVGIAAVGVLGLLYVNKHYISKGTGKKRAA
jgi:hypothetical protein